MNKTKNLPKLPPFKVERVLSTLSQSFNWGLTSLNVPSTWNITKGKGITVAVLDTGAPLFKNPKGILTLHPDLEGSVKVESCKGFIPEEDYIDRNSHSTACCGVIGARNNEFGCCGYAPECTVITFKVLGDSGSGGFDAINKALEECIRIKPDIVSMSLGCTVGNDKMHELIKKLYSMDIPVICAAGNGGEAEGVNYPAKYPETIAIAAYDKNGNIANFSARGDTVDFALPGVNIYTTYLNGAYASMSGTSFSCPACAGIVALLLSKHRLQEKETGLNDCKTVQQIKDHLIKHSISKNIEKTNDFGYGIIDVDQMILNEDQPVTKPLKEPSMFRKIIIAILDFFCGNCKP